MKGKPDLSGFTPRPAPAKPLDDFLREGAADQAAAEGSVAAAQFGGADDAGKPEPTVQKLFRLRWDTVSALRTGAAQESAAQGRRVTETEIVETLIRKRFKLPKL
jgi:hypothetical protein